MRTRYPFFIAVALLGGLVVFLWQHSVTLTHGRFTYALDDAYIHLAMARQLATHQVWGISPNEFSGVSSSLLWTALLSFFFFIFGDAEIAPFVLNILLGTLLLWVLDRLWSKVSLGAPWRLGLLALAFLAVPLASQPMIGMEVSLQCLLVATFFYSIVLWSGVSDRTRDVITLLLAFLLGAVRYECILLVEITAFGFLLRGETRRAVAIGLVGALPALIYGVFAMLEGGTFLPNTLFLKSGTVDAVMRKIPNAWQPMLFVGVSVIALFAILILLTRYVRKHFPNWRPSGTAIGFSATIVTAIAQFAIASPEQQFERYRAYVYIALLIWLGMFVGWLVNRPSTNSSRRYRIAAIVLLAGLSTAHIPKFALYFSKTAIASKNIWDQQVQMARFVGRYCGGKPVVLVDIGAVSYYSNSPVIDLVGLGTDRIARMRLATGDPSDSMNDFIRKSHARVAIIYPILRYRPDPDWIKKGSLVIEDRYVCARDTVDFYALRVSDTEWLRSSLSDFRARTTSKILIY